MASTTWTAVTEVYATGTAVTEVHATGTAVTEGYATGTAVTEGYATGTALTKISRTGTSATASAQVTTAWRKFAVRRRGLPVARNVSWKCLARGTLQVTLPARGYRKICGYNSVGSYTNFAAVAKILKESKGLQE